MRKKKRLLFFLFLAFIFFMTGGYFVTYVKPNDNISIVFFRIQALPVFFILLFGFLSSFITYLTSRKRQGILIGLLLCCYLLLRLYGFTNIFFQILLFALFATIELFFLQNGKQNV